MKLKFLAILAVAGMVMVGCGSNKNDDGTTDSAAVDTNLVAPGATDTTMPDTTMPDSTMKKPVDSTKN